MGSLTTPVSITTTSPPVVLPTSPSPPNLINSPNSNSTPSTTTTTTISSSHNQSIITEPDVDVINLLKEWELEETSKAHSDEDEKVVNNKEMVSSNCGNSGVHPVLESELSSLSNLLSDVYLYERKQQDLVLQLIDALSLVKHSLEDELMTGNNLSLSLTGIHELIQQARRVRPSEDVSLLIHELQLKRKLIEGALIKTLVNPLSSLSRLPTDPLRLIHSFTTSKLSSSGQHLSSKSLNGGLSTTTNGYHQQPIVQRLPRFFFDMEISGVGLGRIVIETRPDVAPRMCENFKQLVTGERGFGFLGCSVFQCWRGESVITGDFEHNNGRGGHSIFESGLFMPEDTRLPSTRGSIGMRRTQKRHDSKGLVGSQFRIMLQDMPGFTGIFGRVVEGIELVDKISECGDPSGNPMKRIIIRRCGGI